jgi:glycerol-3-phosphate acyltransferase PlsY
MEPVRMSRQSNDRPGHNEEVHSVAALVGAFVLGSVPCSQIAARWRAGVDLRRVGTGTVSGTSLFRVAGFGPLAIAGIGDVAKGAAAPLLAGDRPLLAACCAGLAVAGHNWSPFLHGAGGRGLSPAIGALLVEAWPGAIVLLGGMALGRVVHSTGLGSFLAGAALVPVVAITHGSFGALTGVCVVVPMWCKRVLGNRPPARRTVSVYLHRLLFDRDPEPAAVDDR